ncbi:MAG: ATP-binding protein [Prosthecobacter sp.]
MKIRSEPDIVVCRQHARQFSAALGFDLQSQTRIATAVSEIARNAFQYAGGGSVAFSVETENNGQRAHSLRQQSLAVAIQDEGPGIPHLEEVLGGSYHSSTGMGLGITGARRLMDRVEIKTGKQGTRVEMRKNLPPAARRRMAHELQAMVVAEPPRKEPANVNEEVRRQNQELLGVMEEVNQRQEDLKRMNEELEQTNSGVLALYDELETLHRVGMLLASKVDLPAVMQALIEATTDLTGAQFGSCYLFHEEHATWTRYAEAGPSQEMLRVLPKAHGAEFFGVDFTAAGGVRHFADLSVESAPCCASLFAEALSPQVVLRSCLAVPLMSTDDKVAGALVFASADPGIFSERSERIVSSIATQATVAIEKARLFDSVKAASEAKDTFLAMISHELRTPLNPVLSIVSSLHEDRSLPPAVQEDIAVVLRNVQLEVRLIDDLLDFHRIIKGNLSLAAEPVDMHAMIRNVVEICETDIASRSHSIVLTLDAPAHLVLGDPARIQQVLWNVIKNSIKFTGVGGTIAIRTAVAEDSHIVVAITDTGRGIEPQMLKSIFGAFEQGTVEGLTQFGGLGLGLAIAKAFVDKHNGAVFAESPGKDQGSTITIRLPLMDVAAHQALKAEGISNEATGLATETQSILLIDDHLDTLRSLSRLLIRNGYQVTTAGSYADGLARARERQYEVIISDLGLPDGSGLDLIREIRQSCEAPAIALSGYGMEGDVARTLAAGFDRHLTKPVTFQTLLASIRQLLSRGV